MHIDTYLSSLTRVFRSSEFLKKQQPSRDDVLKAKKTIDLREKAKRSKRELARKVKVLSISR